MRALGEIRAGAAAAKDYGIGMTLEQINANYDFYKSSMVDVPELAEEVERLKSLIGRAIRGLKHVGKFRYEPGDEPHPLDCCLWARVAHVFDIGCTSAHELCCEFGQDPNFRDDKPVTQQDVVEAFWRDLP
jgi:hypothetical protein